jgi:hypothetical protein
MKTAIKLACGFGLVAFALLVLSTIFVARAIAPSNKTEVPPEIYRRLPLSFGIEYQ